MFAYSHCSFSCINKLNETLVISTEMSVASMMMITSRQPHANRTAAAEALMLLMPVLLV